MKNVPDAFIFVFPAATSSTSPCMLLGQLRQPARKAHAHPTNTQVFAPRTDPVVYSSAPPRREPLQKTIVGWRWLQCWRSGEPRVHVNQTLTIVPVRSMTFRSLVMQNGYAQLKSVLFTECWSSISLLNSTTKWMYYQCQCLHRAYLPSTGGNVSWNKCHSPSLLNIAHHTLPLKNFDLTPCQIIMTIMIQYDL